MGGNNSKDGNGSEYLTVSKEMNKIEHEWLEQFKKESKEKRSTQTKQLQLRFTLDDIHLTHEKNEFEGLFIALYEQDTSQQHSG